MLVAVTWAPEAGVWLESETTRREKLPGPTVSVGHPIDDLLRKDAAKIAATMAPTTTMATTVRVCFRGGRLSIAIWDRGLGALISSFVRTLAGLVEQLSYRDCLAQLQLLAYVDR